jgi:hypothetical protein
MAVLLDPTFGEWLAFIRCAAIRLGKSKKPPFQAAAALLSFDLPPSTKTRISAPVDPIARMGAFP